MDKEMYQCGKTNHWAVGLGHHDEGIQRIGKAIEAQFPDGNVISEDATGWDMSVSPESLVMTASSRANTWTVNDRPGMAYLTMLDGYAHMGHILQIGNRLFASCVYGRMATGKVTTTTDNNRMRTFDSLYAGANKTITAEDDLLSDRPLDPTRARHTGALRKESTSVNWKNGGQCLSRRMISSTRKGSGPPRS